MMNISIEQDELQKLISRVIGAVSKRNTVPILGNVLLSATDALRATTTDLDMEISARADASVEKPGETTVNATLLAGIVAKLPKGSLVKLDLKDDILHIKAGRSNFKLQTLPVEDFPKFSGDDFQASLPFAGLELKNALDKTTWAVSRDETRYYLNGIAMQWRDGKANFIATDGHRLAWYHDGETAEFNDIIIPSSAAKQFISSLDEGEAVLNVSERSVRLTFGDVVISSKVIDGTYPDWKRVLPQNTPNSISLSSIDAKAAIERVSVVATERTKSVRFEVEAGELTLRVQDATGGSATEQITVSQSGDDVIVGLNSRYALDAFAQADKGDVTVHYGGAMDTLKVSYDKEPSLTAVVMPMRLN